MTPLEKAARALFDREWCGKEPHDEFERTRAYWEDSAKALLRAIAEPTPEMIAAALATPGMAEVDRMCIAAQARHLTAPKLMWHERGEEPPLTQAWRAMLDTIIGGSE